MNTNEQKIEQGYRDRIEQEYDRESSGTIRSPGKFEGEPLWAVRLWEIGLDGFADTDLNGVFSFTIPKDDPLRAVWPELDKWLGRKRSVRLREDDNGFVHAY